MQYFEYAGHWEVRIAKDRLDAQTLPHFRFTSFLHLICKLIISIFAICNAIKHGAGNRKHNTNTLHLFWSAHRNSRKKTLFRFIACNFYSVGE